MKRAHALLLLLVVLLLAIPAAPIESRTYVLQVLTFMFVSVVLAQSYDIVGGQMGYVNLGHITFFAVGAYAFGILFNLNMGLLASLALGTAVVVVFAALISYPFFRLRGAYFSLAAFGLVKLMEQLTINLGWLTGGSNGLKVTPGNRVLAMYYASLGVVAAVVVASWLIERSRLGLALKTIREDEEVAEDFGVPTFRVKAQALILSAVFPAIIGGLYTWYINFIDPNQVYGLSVALTPVAMAMLGGSGVLVGPVLGAVFLYLMQELIYTQTAHLHGAMMGLVIVLVGLFMPGGLVRLGPVARVLRRLGLTVEEA
ncbi:MAG TPA: branched-chain amino acid ABC transporter permease [bacterium]|nr:branched-chain amino acid ABC transporter permease [bacterium]